MSALDRLHEIEARAAAATDGPWHVVERAAAGYVPHYGVGYSQFPGVPTIAYAHTDREGYGNGSRKVDATFIAAARQDVPALVAALRAVLAVADRLTTRDGPHPWHDHLCPDSVSDDITDAITAALDGAA